MSWMQVWAEQRFGRPRALTPAPCPPLKQGPLVSPVPATALKAPQAAEAHAQQKTPAARAADDPHDLGMSLLLLMVASDELC